MTTELTVAGILRAFATGEPDGIALVHGSTRLTFAELWVRSCRVANVLTDLGATVEAERSELDSSASGQAHVGLVLRNGPEYLELMLGAFIARATTFNVNFRYTATELAALFADAQPRVVVAHDEFVPQVREALARLGSEVPLLRVGDDSDVPLQDDLHSFDALVTAAAPEPPRTDWSPDDLYLLFTGGTTGYPKGVMWRQGDALVAAFGVVDRAGEEHLTAEAVVRDARPADKKRRVIPTPPLMHGAAQWLALGALLTGNQVVIQREVRVLDPDELLRTAAREGATEIMLVGDAFGRPIADAAEATSYAVPSLLALLNGGAALSVGTRDRLLRAFPGVRVVDSIGSSESGRQATRTLDGPASTSEFQPLGGNVVLSADKARVLPPDDPEVGWLAKAGRVPLGYLNDPAKTAATFPMVDGVRFAVPGDRARWTPEGIQVLGRESTTINSGGEKVFGEEVEAALLTHPAVRDVIVVGRPSDQWGEEVVAVVEAAVAVSSTELIEHAGGALARYKLPKAIVFVDTVPRTPAGKPSHGAAQEIVRAAAGAGR